MAEQNDQVSSGHKMFVPTAKTVYVVKRVPSIFTNRSGKEDCYISKQCKTHGARESDGKLYSCVARIAAESGEFIRSHEPLPAEITLPLLHQWGFVSSVSNPVPLRTTKDKQPQGTSFRM